MTKITGILSALITPYSADGSVNYAMTRKLVRHQLDAGIAGFFVNGGTGEGILLDPHERKTALETVMDEAGDECQVIAHVGAVATHTAADLAAHAQSVGAMAIAAIPPIYFKVDLAGLRAYYQEIADAAPDLPLWLYNIPGATGVTVTPDMFTELLNIPQIAGIKYTSYDFFSMRRIIELDAGRDISVLSGPDELCLPALVMGSDGAIGTTYNILPGLFAELYNLYRDGDLEGAQAKQFQANRVIKAFTAVPSLAAVKAILGRMGFDCGVPRSPLRGLDSSQTDLLWQKLEEAEFSSLIDLPF